MKIRSLVLALIALLPGPASSAQDKPNVVLMLADNLGYGDLICLFQADRAVQGYARRPSESACAQLDDVLEAQ